MAEGKEGQRRGPQIARTVARATKKAPYEGAGMLSLYKTLERPLPVNGWVIPAAVWKREDSEEGWGICWAWIQETWAHDPHGAVPRAHDDEEKILWGFVRLATQEDPDEFVEYASEYGPLYLCLHNAPINNCPQRARLDPTAHTPVTLALQEADGALAQERLEGSRRDTDHCELRGFEPIETWRHFARLVGEALDVSNDLHTGRMRPPEYWRQSARALGGATPWEGDVPSQEERKRHIVEIMEFLIRASDVRVRFRWGAEAGPAVVYDGVGVLGAVVRQLIHSVARKEGVYRCDSCGELFSASKYKRKPPAGREFYFCPDRPACHQTGAARLRKQKQRERQRRKTKRTKPKDS
jgi:hypothetical protein